MLAKTLIEDHEKLFLDEVTAALRETGLAAAYKPAGVTARQLAENLSATARGLKHSCNHARGIPAGLHDRGAHRLRPARGRALGRALKPPRKGTANEISLMAKSHPWWSCLGSGRWGSRWNPISLRRQGCGNNSLRSLLRHECVSGREAADASRLTTAATNEVWRGQSCANALELLRRFLCPMGPCPEASFGLVGI